MGGNNIKSSIPIRGDWAGTIADSVIEKLRAALRIAAEPGGSTGKKRQDQMSGDVDVLIDMQYTEENVARVVDFIKREYKDVEIVKSPGLKLISFGLPVNISGESAIVQVDLMFTENLEFAKFIYYSPDYRKNESEYKGMFRTNLLPIVASARPLDPEKYPTTYFDIPGYEGVVETKWKLSLNYTTGLKLKHLTYLGKKGKPVKTPREIEGDTKQVASSPQNILAIIMGTKATVDDTRSFESLVAYLCSPAYEFRTEERLNEIFDKFLKDVRHTKTALRPMWDAARKYISDAMAENGLKRVEGLDDVVFN